MRIMTSLVSFAAVLAVTACSERTPANGGAAANSDAEPISNTAPANSRMAVAHLSPTEGNEANGTVRFLQMNDGVQVIADIQGLEPGEHGFHVHQDGDCSAADGSSAGGHFNPTNQAHGARDAAQRHVGDMGNITANAAGSAHLEYVDAHLSLSGPNSIVDKAVIVHGGRDDFESQPSGDAGPRVACGVVELQ